MAINADKAADKILNAIINKKKKYMFLKDGVF
ncbi:hypothetical protein J2Z42_000444 [Clostridium algifaecis]|uniref:Uncharacterized protein n=1 Tax=Clostridium algifaecis TaxID=1472040 RepID=A0ABS4KSE4_9CLOT|nr:hypothetical protein [Clostridium algifaecis]